MENMDLLFNSLEYMEKHLKGNMKTVDIANACCCSKSTLEKLFHYVYHISVHEYMVRRRMTLAAKYLSERPDVSILSVAVEYGYNSHEAFARAFKEIWNCNPSEFRKRKYAELFPRFHVPVKEGDAYIMERRIVDISQLYDLFCERKDCYFVCCDIKSLVPINAISRKAGDLAILETMQRMNAAASGEDIVFRIGGDEFCMLTNSSSRDYAERIIREIEGHNDETFAYEGQQIPLRLWVTAAKFGGTHMKYNELFTELHLAIKDAKPNG